MDSGTGTWSPDLQALLDYVTPILAHGADEEYFRESVCLEEFITYLCALVAEHLAVDIDANTLTEDLRKLLPRAAPPARALAHAIVFSNILVPYIGVTMAQQLQTKSLEGFGAPPQDESMELA